MKKKIPFQKNDGGIVALLPNGRVDFFDHFVEKKICEYNESSFAFEPNYFESHVIKHPLVNTKNFRLSAPVIAFIEITNLCNLTCKHCYAYSSPKSKRKRELSLEEIKSILNVFDEIGVLQVFLTGGEVFTHPDIVHIITHAMSKKYSVQIFTNGTLISEQHLKTIPTGASFFISFDTADPVKTIRGKMNFPILKKKFELMKKYSHSFRTAVSVHNYNIEHVEEIFQWCKDNNYPRPQWLETHPLGRALMHKDILIPAHKVNQVFQIYQKCMNKYIKSNAKKDNGIQILETIKFCQRLERATNMEKCSRSLVYITSDAYVYPCSNCMSARLYSGGNLREKSFLEIWENGFSEFRKITFSSFNICNSCDINQKGIWCQFRCPPLSLTVSKDITGCGANEYLKEFMRRTTKYWKNRAEKNLRLSNY